MSPTLSIARQTFTEALRQPVYSVMLCSCVMIIHLQPPMAQYVFRAQEKLVTDAGLSVVLLGSWIAAAFCANRAINLEIESGTALLILSKPVGWFQFLLAKFIGILAAVLLFASTTGMALLITLQIAVDQYRYDFTVFYSMVAAYLGAQLVAGWFNYRRKTSYAKPAALITFAATFVGMAVTGLLPRYSSGRYVGPPTGHSIDVVYAIILVALAALAMGSIATALSTQLSVTTNVSCCLLFFFLGLISDHVYGVSMALADVELAHALYFWPLVALPLFILAWVAALKRYDRRKRADCRRWQVHAGFALVSLCCIGRAVIVFFSDVASRPPSPLMAMLAKPVGVIRNSVMTFLHAVIPNWQQFWMADALTSHKPIPAAYVGLSSIYAMLLIAGAIVIAYLLFIDREIGSRSST